MPLLAGKSRKVVGANIAEMLGSFKRKGKIGNVKPRNKSHALRIARAAALRTAGLSNRD